jgi:hypothetical protein
MSAELEKCHAHLEEYDENDESELNLLRKEVLNYLK